MKLPNLHKLVKKSPSFPRTLDLGTFGANSVLNKGKSSIPPLFNGSGVLSSASDKAKLFAKDLYQSPGFDESGISLPVSLIELI